MKTVRIETKKSQEIKQLYQLRFALLNVDTGSADSAAWAKVNLDNRIYLIESYLNKIGPSKWFYEVVEKSNLHIDFYAF